MVYLYTIKLYSYANKNFIMLPNHKTKIIATIGSSSSSKDVLKKLIKSGMNVARINFAHGSFEEHAKIVERIRAIAEKLGKKVAILGDLPGIKIRIGKLEEEPVILNKGETVVLTTRNVEGNSSTIPVEFKDFPNIVSKGDLIYLSDGLIKLRVEDVRSGNVICKVLVGGKLFSRKGINIPKADLPLEAVTEKDLEILKFMIELNFDAVGVSFVGSAYDLIKVRRFIHRRNTEMFVIAKIERIDAVKNFDEILNSADGIMIARGDLGVEIPIEKLPIIQKKLIRKANYEGKPAITATQMLESMTTDKMPTRAEVTDVANAILDGSDAVMLSEETAVGKYPVEAVRMMVKIARVTESYLRPTLDIDEIRKGGTIKDAISVGIIEALKVVDVKFIVTPTRTGRTPRLISRFRPKQWILAFSSNERTCGGLVFSYGVQPFLMEEGFSESDVLNIVKDLGLVRSGDTIMITESKPADVGTNTIRILRVD